MRRVRAEAGAGYPDRVELRDLEPGEHALLLNHVHQPADTPFRASHAIFVREGARRTGIYEDELPPSLRARLLSLRAFDADHMMIAADVVEGAQSEPLIRQMLENSRTAYLHAHYARRGCYAALIERC
jgi:hypothetical protein